MPDIRNQGNMLIKIPQGALQFNDDNQADDYVDTGYTLNTSSNSSITFWQKLDQWLQ